MPRPKKCRYVGFPPDFVAFKPLGIPSSELEETVLTVDEMEAVRLADLDGSYHEEAAAKMRVSRQTFGNIISSARKKIADFLVNGKVLRIEGGTLKMDERKFRCSNCSHEWIVPFGAPRPAGCPECGEADFHRNNPPGGAGCKGKMKAGGPGNGQGRGRCCGKGQQK